MSPLSSEVSAYQIYLPERNHHNTREKLLLLSYSAILLVFTVAVIIRPSFMQAFPLWAIIVIYLVLGVSLLVTGVLLRSYRLWQLDVVEATVYQTTAFSKRHAVCSLSDITHIKVRRRTDVSAYCDTKKLFEFSLDYEGNPEALYRAILNLIDARTCS